MRFPLRVMMHLMSAAWNACYLNPEILRQERYSDVGLTAINGWGPEIAVIAEVEINVTQQSANKCKGRLWCAWKPPYYHKGRRRGEDNTGSILICYHSVLIDLFHTDGGSDGSVPSYYPFNLTFNPLGFNSLLNSTTKTICERQEKKHMSTLNHWINKLLKIWFGNTVALRENRYVVRC